MKTQYIKRKPLPAQKRKLQCVLGFIVLALSVLLVFVMEIKDIHFLFFTVPLGLWLVFTKRIFT